MNLSRICFPAANKDSIEATNLVEWNMAAIMWFIWRLFETLGSTQVAWLHAYLLKGRSICKVTFSVDSSWDLRKKKKKILHFKREPRPFNEIQSGKWTSN